MRSKWWVSLSVLVLAVFLATSAFAQLISWPRHWKVKFTDWEYFNPSITPPYDADGNPDTNFGDGIEDNWGIAVITSMYDLDLSGATPIWSDAFGDDKSLRVFFYGLDLAYWNADNTYGMAAIPSGAYLEIYEWDEDWNNSIVNIGNRVGNTFTGITNGGTLLARFEFTYGATSDPNIVAAGQTDDLSNPPNGTGHAFLKIVGGLYQNVWDIDRDELLATTLLDGISFDPAFVDPEADLFISFRFFPTSQGGFHLRSEDPAYGATIPEPASLMLVGTGLLAIGVFVRKKKLL